MCTCKLNEPQHLNGMEIFFSSLKGHAFITKSRRPVLHFLISSAFTEALNGFSAYVYRAHPFQKVAQFPAKNVSSQDQAEDTGLSKFYCHQTTIRGQSANLLLSYYCKFANHSGRVLTPLILHFTLIQCVLTSDQ